MCYTKDYFIEKYATEDEIVLYEAITDRIKGIFWCKEEQFCGDDSRDSCGKKCRAYKPRNGKSGCCKHYTTKLYTHGDRIKLTPAKDLTNNQ